MLALALLSKLGEGESGLSEKRRPELVRGMKTRSGGVETAEG
jgi:hypothetical protein